jgi:DNA-binding SARP family transcriptional activator
LITPDVRQGVVDPMGDHRLDLAPKFVPPGPSGLLRERLLAVGGRRVGVVLAPAGHGKTTLLGQVAARFDGDVAWYRLDGADRRPDRLAAGVARTLLRPLGLDPAAEAALATLDDVAVALDRLYREKPARRVLLVLDDFHEVAGGDAERDVARFVSHAPAQLHVLLGARRVTGLDLVELRMSGSALLLEEGDLRFRSWEVERLFRDVYGTPLAPEDAAALTRRTDGWAAGLAMFHLLTSGRPAEQRRRAIGDLSRGSRLVRSYLVREVLGDLPPELREFLRRTSALGVLTGPLCDALLERTGSQDVLEELEQRRLFTTTDDDGRRFRYHQVLLDHLELELTEHLGAEESRAWYARAGTVLLDAGEVTAAFRAYARAEDWGAVEQLLHRHGAQVVATPLGAVENLLPVELASQDPWLLLATARRLASRGALAEAVAAFRHAGDVAEDAQLATICREEARGTALWLPGGDPLTRGPAGLVRAATRRNPRHVLATALGLDGPEGRLTAAVAALLAGDLPRAASLLDQAGEHPDAAPRTLTVVACLRQVLVLLRPAGTPVPARTLDEPSLETLLLGADVAGWPWVARIGRALLDAVAGETASLTRLAADADREQDLWGSALVRFADGLARRDADLLTDAAARLARLDAPVPAQWARSLAAAVQPDADPRRTEETARAARAAGLRVEAVVGAWAGPDARAVGLRPAEAPVTAPITLPRAAPPAAPVEGAGIVVRVLGRFAIEVDGVPVDLGGVRPRARATLRLLAMRAGEVVHRDVLAGELWPDAGSEAATRSLQVAVSSLRVLLGREMLVREGDGYRLELPPGGRCDLREFEAAVAAARAARAAGDRPRERAALREALDRYAGDLLPEEGAAEWVVGERERLRVTAATAAEALARRLADVDAEAAVDAARRAVELDAYRDSAWRLLAELHETTGDQAAAHAARERHRKVLAELGVPT